MNQSAIMSDSPINKPAVSSWAMFRTLCGVALFSGLIIVIVYQTTLPFIQENRRKAIERAVFEVLPGATQRLTFSVEADGPRLITEDEVVSTRMYAGLDGSGNLVGIALEAMGQGYQDVIRLMYGYDPERELIVGMTILEMRETPGLGDKIAHDPRFLANFEALDVSLNADRTDFINPVVAVDQGDKINPWEVDGITGATISTQAVTRIIGLNAKEITPYILEHHDVLKGASS